MFYIINIYLNLNLVTTIVTTRIFNGNHLERLEIND